MGWNVSGNIPPAPVSGCLPKVNPQKTRGGWGECLGREEIYSPAVMRQRVRERPVGQSPNCSIHSAQGGLPWSRCLPLSPRVGSGRCKLLSTPVYSPVGCGQSKDPTCRAGKTLLSSRRAESKLKPYGVHTAMLSPCRLSDLIGPWDSPSQSWWEGSGSVWGQLWFPKMILRLPFFLLLFQFLSLHPYGINAQHGSGWFLVVFTSPIGLPKGLPISKRASSLYVHKWAEAAC